MSSPISSNMDRTARSPELCHFELASRTKTADVGHLRVGYLDFGRPGDERRGQ
jgi:hypothetical protein